MIKVSRTALIVDAMTAIVLTGGQTWIFKQ